MAINPLIISLASSVRHLNINAEFENWLLAAYGWESYDNQWSPEELIDIIEARCNEYNSGTLDTTLPDNSSLWEKRAETTKYILQGVLLEKDSLIEECQRLIQLLDENNISY